IRQIEILAGEFAQDGARPLCDVYNLFKQRALELAGASRHFFGAGSNRLLNQSATLIGINQHARFSQVLDIGARLPNAHRTRCQYSMAITLAARVDAVDFYSYLLVPQEGDEPTNRPRKLHVRRAPPHRALAGDLVDDARNQLRNHLAS